MLKKCRTCGVEYEATTENFYKKSTGRDGLTATCRYCILAQQKKYAEEHKEQIKKYMKEYCVEYAKKNKAKIRKYQREYHQKNIEVRHKKHRKNREDAKERIREYQYHYCRKNKEAYRQRRQKRRAMEKNLKSTFTNEQWEYAQEYFNHKCCYCGKKKKLQQDHFVPLSKGGEYTNENIVPSCQRCNVSKCNRDFQEWYPKQEYFSELRQRAIVQYLKLIKGDNKNERKTLKAN